MRRALSAILLFAAASGCRQVPDVCGNAFCLSVGEPQTVDGLGRAQGLEVRDGVVWIFGDASTGVIRGFELDATERLVPTGRAISLTVAGAERVRHPTGLTFDASAGTFLGDTVDEKGTLYKIDWSAALAGQTLDRAIAATSLDDAAVNGSRPEFVRWQGRALIASADYGGSGNEVRLYDPARLATGASTSDQGVTLARFPVTGHVQALHYWEERDVLILVQNRRHGSGWRLTLVNLAASVQSGNAVVLDVLEPVLPGELEGFHFVDPGGPRALMVTSAKKENVWPATLIPKQK